MHSDFVECCYLLTRDIYTEDTRSSWILALQLHSSTSLTGLFTLFIHLLVLKSLAWWIRIWMHAWFPLCATMQYWMYGTPFGIEKTHYTTDCDAFHRFIHAKRSTVGMIIHVVLNKKCSLAPFRGTALPIHESIGNLLDCLTTPAHPKIIYFYKLHNFIHLGSILYRAWGNNVASLFKDGYIYFF